VAAVGSSGPLAVIRIAALTGQHYPQAWQRSLLNGRSGSWQPPPL
jgi:hypothetical protein